MQKLTVCTLVAIGSALTIGACHNHHRPRTAVADRDRDADERLRGRDRDVDHDEHADESHSPDVGSGLKAKHAVHAIAKARCERERRCENVGPDKSYVSMDACEAKIENEWGADLNKYECPRGIVQSALDNCIAHVRGEECGNPFDTLSRIAQCDADDICDGD
jgi:hypothetical protein